MIALSKTLAAIRPGLEAVAQFSFTAVGAD